MINERSRLEEETKGQRVFPLTFGWFAWIVIWKAHVNVVHSTRPISLYTCTHNPANIDEESFETPQQNTSTNVCKKIWSLPLLFLESRTSNAWDLLSHRAFSQGVRKIHEGDSFSIAANHKQKKGKVSDGCQKGNQKRRFSRRNNATE